MVSTKPAPTNAQGPCSALQGRRQLDQDRGLVYEFGRHPIQQRDFIKGVRKVPPYTDLFWAMFYKIAPFLGGMKKLILEAKTAEDIEEIRRLRVRVAMPDEQNEGEFVAIDVPMLSNEVWAMIDNMLFLACYGHKGMFEDRVSQSSILAFRSCALKNARDNESEFFHLWKQYLARSGPMKESMDVSKEINDRVNGVMGDDDDDDDNGAAGAAAAAHADAGSAAGRSDEGGVAEEPR